MTKLRQLITWCVIAATTIITQASANSVNRQTRDLLSEELFTTGIEGPAVDASGNLYAVNYARQGTIGVIAPSGIAALFVKLPEGSTGNGIRFGPDGTMFVADYTSHNILAIAPEKKDIRIHAHSDAMHQPNDIAITRDGTIYASDPNWSDNSGQLWLIKPVQEPVLLEAGMGTTNGIEISIDDKLLYVNESVQRRIWVYDLLPDGGISNKRLFYQFSDHGLDGMRSDVKGNLYVARYGAGLVAVVSPQGELLNTVVLKGRYPTNVAFGGKNGKTVYVTMQKRQMLEYFEAPLPGRSFQFEKSMY